jgi:hypothetical protein
MKAEKLYLVGVHMHSFRAGTPSEVIGVKMCTPTTPSFIPFGGGVSVPLLARVCYHIRFDDGKEDYVAKTEVDDGRWKFMTLDEIMRNGVPEIAF